MIPVERILFPVDLTEKSSSLSPYVATFAEKFKAEVHVLYVVRLFRYYVKMYVAPASIEAFESKVEEVARSKMVQFIDENFRELPRVHSDVLFGEPSEAIVKYINDYSINLVVMGTHGRKGLDRVIFGSVAGLVVKNAGVPVLVIKPFTSNQFRARHPEKNNTSEIQDSSHHAHAAASEIQITTMTAAPARLDGFPFAAASCARARHSVKT
jgi:nucleotide-binding universal stress UspA family protein